MINEDNIICGFQYKRRDKEEIGQGKSLQRNFPPLQRGGPGMDFVRLGMDNALGE